MQRMKFIVWSLLYLIICSSLTCQAGGQTNQHDAANHQQTDVTAIQKFIDNAYRRILGRPADAEGLATFTGLILEEGKSEAWIVDALTSSPEGRRVRADRVKMNLLKGGTLFSFILLLFGSARFPASFEKAGRYLGSCRLNPRVLSMVAFVAFFIFYCGFSYWRYATFQFELDWMKIANSVYHSSHGQFLRNYISAFASYSLWKEHLAPLLVFFVPFYWVNGECGDLAMIICQALAVAAAGTALFHIGNVLFRSGWVGLLAQIFFYARPDVQMAVLHDFHMLTIIPFFLFLAYYGLLVERRRFMWIGFACCLLLREDAFFAAAGLPVLLICEKRKWGLASLMIAIMVLYEILLFGFAFPAIRGNDSYAFTGHYSWLADSFRGVAVKLITQPHVVVWRIITERENGPLLAFLARFFWLPLASPTGLCVSLPVMVESLLSNVHQMTSYSYHYVMPPLAALTIGSLLSLRFWSRWMQNKWAYRFFPHCVLLALIIWNIGLSLNAGALPFSSYVHSKDVRLDGEKLHHAQIVGGVLATIPKTRVYAVSANLLGRYHAREHVRVFQGESNLPSECEYLVLDTGNPICLYGFDSRTYVVDRLVASGGWIGMTQTNSIHLLRRTNAEQSH